MAKRKRRDKGRVTVKVVWMAGDTVEPKDVFTATRATSQMWDSGRAVLRLRDGRDAAGKPVARVSYRRAWKITHGPAEGERL